MNLDEFRQHILTTRQESAKQAMSVLTATINPLSQKEEK